MVGLVVGAGLVWFVVADQRRREVDIDAEERAQEARWLSVSLEDEGHHVSPETAERLLALHRAYLEAPPPDNVPLPDNVPPSDVMTAPDGMTARGTRTSELPDDDRRRVERGPVKIRE